MEHACYFSDESNPGANAHKKTSHGDLAGSSLLVVLIFNLLIPGIQIVGGIYANSSAILSDALHNLGDFLTLGLAFVAFSVARKTATATHTFGYKRAEVIAAFFNAIVMAGGSALILKEATEKFFRPQHIPAEWVVGLALVGMVGNGISALLLHRHGKRNINIKSAFIHLMGDFFTSLAVFTGGIVLFFKPWYWIDPLLSVLIVFFIVRNSWKIFKDTLRILMEAAPPDIDLCEVKKSIENIQGILGVHYLHAWTVHPSSVAFSCHIVVEDQLLSNVSSLRKNIEDMLNTRFKINHPVIQFETAPCGTASMICEQSCSSANYHGRREKHSSLAPFAVKGPFAYKRILITIIRILLGGMFIFASIGKILHPKAFAEVVFNYRILPDIFINVVAVLLPWIELVTGICVVIGRGLLGGLTILNCLMVVFFCLIVLNIVRGVDISCGCFSTEIANVSKTTMWLEALRDLVILAIGAWLFRYYAKIGSVQSGASDTKEG